MPMIMTHHHHPPQNPSPLPYSEGEEGVVASGREELLNEGVDGIICLRSEVVERFGYFLLENRSPGYCSQDAEKLTKVTSTQSHSYSFQFSTFKMGPSPEGRSL